MMTAVYPDSISGPVWPTYSARQLNQYFKTIRLPGKYLKHPIIKYKTIHGSNDEEALRVLTYLIRYQIAHIPFENLELHYSTNRSISLNHEHLFRKMVERKTGRGGYCMENTCLFVTVLHSLGYDVITTGARVNNALQSKSQPCDPNNPTFGMWSHMVVIVTIADKRYLVDVGFGNNSLTFPVPLEEGYTAINGRPTTQIRLQREPVPDSALPNSMSQMLWVLGMRLGIDPNAPWMSAYCFSEHEFLPQDFKAMSTYVSRNPRSWFTNHIICMKFLMDKPTGEIVGDITLLGSEVKERRSGTSKVLARLECEKDRIQALHKFLSIRLSDNEKKGIMGSPSMIKPATKAVRA